MSSIPTSQRNEIYRAASESYEARYGHRSPFNPQNQKLGHDVYSSRDVGEKYMDELRYHAFMAGEYMDERFQSAIVKWHKNQQSKKKGSSRQTEDEGDSNETAKSLMNRKKAENPYPWLPE